MPRFKFAAIWVITLFFLVASLRSYSIEKPDPLRYQHAKSAPDASTIDELVRYLVKGADGDSRKVETFFYWIGLNIEYSTEMARKSELSEHDVSATTAFSSGKTICAGYANLMLEMCRLAKIECVIITGIAQNYLNELVNSPNHAWNAVRIDGDWKLVDATWGSGGIRFGTDEYEKKTDLRYLFADPEFLIIDHFPEDQYWQLRDKPVAIGEFQGKVWDERRFRKFNNLLDDDEYEIYMQAVHFDGTNQH